MEALHTVRDVQKVFKKTLFVFLVRVTFSALPHRRSHNGVNETPNHYHMLLRLISKKFLEAPKHSQPSTGGNDELCIGEGSGEPVTRG